MTDVVIRPLVAGEESLFESMPDPLPLLAWLGLLDEAARGDLLAEAVRVLSAGGAHEVVADVDAHRVAVLADLERAGFTPVRSRVVFGPAGPDAQR
jgi:hypothetical protein